MYLNGLTGLTMNRNAYFSSGFMPKKIPRRPDFQFTIPDHCFFAVLLSLIIFERTKDFPGLSYAGGGALILLGVIVTNNFSARFSAKGG